MKLGVIVSDFRNVDSAISRLKAEKLGIILVSNGVYHATVKEAGRQSPVLGMSSNLYALTEDLQIRGFSDSDMDSRVKAVTYNDLVDLIFNDYEKVIWI